VLANIKLIAKGYSMYWIGVDTGGTFTDLVTYNSSTGELRSLKTPSTPNNHAAGVMRAVSETGIHPSEINTFAHGTTVATNTALEQNGSKIGVITTSGYRDVLIVGRGNRTQLYDLTAVRPKGFVERHQVFEVRERVTVDGEIYEPLNEDDVRKACNAFLTEEVETIAVCFLHSYANSQHEARAAEIIRSKLPNIHISTSSTILPEYREFERFSTTALNAYVAPKTSKYLKNLEQDLLSFGLKTPIKIMGSNGGTWSVGQIAERPANALLSGPAGGVIAATKLAAALNIEDIITYDMGGTSTDACMIRNGSFNMNPEGMVDWYPNRVPQIDINTVGAGGGSIAFLEAGDFLNVGPKSAGAEPGPACYSKGGTEPTVTDANVVLGRFLPSDPLGGAINLDIEAARFAVGKLAKKLKLSVEQMAEGIIKLAVIRMTASVKEISVMRGIDPRDFALVAYGGAGPMHGALIADELDMNTIIIPPIPGNFSAFGLLLADTRQDISKTEIIPIEETNIDAIRANLLKLEQEGRDRLQKDGFSDDNIDSEFSLDMRYTGQSFELNIPFIKKLESIEKLLETFHQAYEQRYSHTDRGAAEIVAFRVATIVSGERPEFPKFEEGDNWDIAKRDERLVTFDGVLIKTPVFWREELPLENKADGPAIIEEPGSTTVVPPNFGFRRDITGSLILSKLEQE
tara:strand:+ start:1302 stop:3365 length:2064 start_codon:yes stop_codon:yes gene_type:complete